MQAIYQGRTNNHINWVMVDATDFATPESALSAATTIKIYGQLRSATGTNFVSSGTGSLTNDITHVGASVTGIYHIALAKADISDASAAFYDVYTVHLSATGAARQTLVFQGVRADDSYVSNVLSYLSNMVSNLSGLTSDAHSAAILAASNASEAQSNALLILSRLSDLDSRLASEFSDLYSLLSDHHSTMGSQFAVTSNYLSNASNYLSYISGVVSTLGAAPTASAIAAKVWSDYQSKVGQTPSQVYSNTSNYLSYISAVVSGLGTAPSASAIADKVWSDFGSKVGATPSQLYSVTLLAGSRVSDIQSYLVAMSGMLSDTHSAATAGVITASAIADKVWSDFQSKAGASPSQMYSVILVGDSAASDAASAAAQANSRVLLVQSRLSDLDSRLASDVSDMRSALSDFQSDFQSRVPKAVATNSQVSDLSSDLRSYLISMSAVLSDTYSAVSNVNSLVAARLPEGIQKNTALSNFEFLMVDSTDHATPETGLTITATRSIDGAAFAACANSAAEVSNGIYQINLAASDLNGTVITFRFTATGADDRFVTIKTGP